MGDIYPTERKIHEVVRMASNSTLQMKVFALGDTKVGPLDERLFAVCSGDIGLLLDSLKSYDPDVIHLNRPGVPREMVSSLVSARRDMSVETLQFAVWDNESASIRRHVVVSEFLLRTLIRRARLARGALGNFSVIGNPVDLERLSKVDSKHVDAIRAEFGADDGLLLGMASNPYGTRYNKRFLSCLGALKRKVPRFKFLALGGLPPDFKQALDRRGLSRNVFDVGSFPNDDARLYQHIAALDIYASYTVVGETFGIAIAEAMALARPVVTNSTPWECNAQADLVDNRINGLVAQSDEGWAAAIVHLLENPGLRLALGARGQEKVLVNCQPKDTVSRLQALYESLSEKPNPPGSFDMSEVEERFREKKRDLYDHGREYLVGRWAAYVQSRKTIAGSWRGALEAVAAKLVSPLNPRD
ncbi:MAG: glycosyltransferase family 4 protein [Nitrososphaerota archaeon]|nr:glycosyltransferase family 4 protein [Nitrososphaerota archaeon]